MAFQDRLRLYANLEGYRGKPLIVYVTSTRANAVGQIAQDVIPELINQLHSLPATEDLDFLVISNGGDGTVAWRIVSLIREQVKKFSILIPHAAFSAATLIALGADEIVMHPYGNLGPTDPQIHNPKKAIQFGAEDVQAFLRFAREKVGLTDQEPLRDLFLKFGEEVGFTSIGVAARSSQLSLTMGEKMLQHHMKDEKAQTKAKAISEALNSKYFHHGYPVSRSEAGTIGLPIAKPDRKLEDLMWAIWKDLESELKIRETFVPLDLVRANPACQGLFAPVAQLQLPVGANGAALQILFQMYLQQVVTTSVPPTAFDNTLSIVESTRKASRFQMSGSIFAARQHDLEMKVQVVPEKMGWIDVTMPAAAAQAAGQGGGGAVP